ncbi:MAG: ABC transporter permease [Candidatus Aminicenantes bacterium]|jgi:putative ABC transport system permease protein
MKTKSKTPSPLAVWLLSRMTGEDERGSVINDFSEIYAEIKRDQSTRAARRWYWAQVLKSIPMFLRIQMSWGAAMIKNYFKIAFRILKRKKVFSFINIAGLTIGIMCSLFILLLIHYEFSYDRHTENAENIYRIIIQWPIEFMNTDKITWTSARLGPFVKEQFPDVEMAVRVDDVPGGVSLSHGNRIFSEEAFYFVDPDFLTMFSTPFIQGHSETALNQPLSVVISEKAAKKYFAGENPLENALRYNDKYDFQVTGIFKNVPENTHFTYDFLASFQSLFILQGKDARYIPGWTSMNYQTYIQLREGTDSIEFAKAMEKYLVENTPQSQEDYHYFLQPLTKIHLGGNIPGELAQNSHMKYIYIFAGIALLIIIITCFNYINLSTACFSARAGEINARKVVGANRKHLIQQFMIEAFLSTMIAFVLALILLYLVMPLVNAVIGAGIEFALLKEMNILVSVIVLVCMVGFLSAYYPALHMSSYKSTSHLKSGKFAGDKRSGLSRNLLVVIQFVISIVLIVSAITIHRQVDFIVEKNLGQLNDPIVTLPVVRDNKEIKESMDVFSAELKKESAIKGVSFSSWLPTNIRAGDYAVWDGQEEGERILFHNLRTDCDFLDLYGLPLIKGRNFSRDFPSDMTQAYIVNETAIRLMQMEDPIGKRFGYSYREGVIIGVVKDFHFVPMHQRIKPLAIRWDPQDMRFISIKIDSQNMSRAIQLIEKQWKDLSPGFAFEYSFIDDEVEALYRSEKRLNRAITLFTYIALFLASLGLFGLVMFSVEKRVKEIGVRKVLGARTLDIVALLSKDFIRLVLLANLIALPLAYTMIRKWLQSFAYRVDLNVWIFIVSSLAVLVVSLLTVSYQTVKAATANPVDSLRYE